MTAYNSFVSDARTYILYNNPRVFFYGKAFGLSLHDKNRNVTYYICPCSLDTSIDMREINFTLPRRMSHTK